MTEWLACHYARIIDEELDGEVVCAVNDEVVVLDDVEGIVCHKQILYGIDLYVGVDGEHLLLGTLYLRCVNIFGEVDYLTLQI